MQLNVAFKLHEIEKRTGKLSNMWKQWLQDTVGIQVSYARKLKEIVKILTNSPRFRKLGLSISDIYQLRKEIYSLLKTNAIAAKFWAGGQVPVIQ